MVKYSYYRNGLQATESRLSPHLPLHLIRFIKFGSWNWNFRIYNFWLVHQHLVAQKVDKNPTFHLGKWNLDRGNGQIAEMICVWSFLYFFLHCVATTASGNDILVLRIFFNLYKGDCFPTEETEKREQKWNHPTLLLTLNKG